jgi:Beta-propeller repeat
LFAKREKIMKNGKFLILIIAIIISCEESKPDEGDKCFPNPCDFNNALCTVENNEVHCECKEGFEGNGYVCYQTACFQETEGFGCGDNAYCDGDTATDSCICKIGYLGDPISGCYECNEDLGYSQNGSLCVPLENPDSGIIFNELMIEPYSTPQYIELKNISNHLINLTGCAIDINGNNYLIDNPGMVVNAGEYLIISSQETITPGSNTHIRFPNLETLFRFGSMSLVCNGLDVDSISWDSNWNYVEGRSFNLSPAVETAIDDTAENYNDRKQYWCVPRNTDISYNDYGTPGKANELCIVENCILRTPITHDATIGLTELSVFVDVYAWGLTSSNGISSNIVVSAGYKNNLLSDWSWVDVTQSGVHGGDFDKYAWNVQLDAGNYYYVFRASIDGGLTNTICDNNGTDTPYTGIQHGTINLDPFPEGQLESVHFPTIELGGFSQDLTVSDDSTVYMAGTSYDTPEGTGDQKAFIYSLDDRNKSLIWDKFLGLSTTMQGFNTISHSESGFICAGGLFNGGFENYSFDHGDGVPAVTMGETDGFVKCYNHMGYKYEAMSNAANNFMQYKDSSIIKIIIDSDDNVLVAGQFDDDLIIKGGDGTIKGNLSNSGGFDLFIHNTNLGWLRKIGGLDDESYIGIANSGTDVIAVFSTDSTLLSITDGNSTVNINGSGGWDFCVAKYDLNGNLLWGKRFGGSGKEFVNDVKVDSLGNIYVVGQFAGNFKVGEGINEIEFVSIGIDGFVSKFSPSGIHLKSYQLTGAGNELAKSVTMSSSGKIYVGGDFDTELSINDGVNIYTISHSSSFLAGFVLGIDNTVIWLKKVNKSNNIRLNSIVYKNGFLWIGGTWAGGISNTEIFGEGAYEVSQTSTNISYFYLKYYAN